MSLFEELKRRNVFRVGIAYLIVSWVLAQVADLVLDNIGAPIWVMQAILLVLALGFPLFLLFSWAFEVTTEGIKREADVDRSESITHHTGRKLDRSITILLIIAVVYFFWESRIADNRPPNSAVVSQQAVAEPESQLPTIDAQTDEHLWAEIFDRELTTENLFAIHEPRFQAAESRRQDIFSVQRENLKRLEAGEML